MKQAIMLAPGRIEIRQVERSTPGPGPDADTGRATSRQHWMLRLHVSCKTHEESEGERLLIRPGRTLIDKSLQQAVI